MTAQFNRTIDPSTLSPVDVKHGEYAVVPLTYRFCPPLPPPPQYWSRWPLQALHPRFPAQLISSLQQPQVQFSTCRIVKAPGRGDILRKTCSFLVANKAFCNFAVSVRMCSLTDTQGEVGCPPLSLHQSGTSYSSRFW